MSNKRFHTGAIKNLSRAPYRTQVLTRLAELGMGEDLSPEENAKIERCARFLPARQCAEEITEGRGWK